MTTTTNETFAYILQNTNDTLVLDGGFATHAETLGCNIDGDLWSSALLVDPDKRWYMAQIHKDFLSAGADIVISNGYQSSFEGFERVAGLSRDEARGLFKLAVSEAVSARDEFWAECQTATTTAAAAATSTSTTPPIKARRKPFVAVSVGPYGASLADGSEYSGKYEGMTPESLREWHRERLAELQDTDADLFAFETIPSLAEVQALTSVIHEHFPTTTSGWLSVSCSSPDSLSSGDAFADAVAVVASTPELQAIGVNCTPPEYITALIKIAKTTAPELAVVVYPNSGEGWDADARAWLPPSQSQADSLAHYVPEWIEAGARVIGGCCRTTPGNVADIRNAVDLLRGE